MHAPAPPPDPSEAPVPVAWERTDLGGFGSSVPDAVGDHDWAATEIIPARPGIATEAPPVRRVPAFETPPLGTAPPRRTPAPRGPTAGPTLTPVGAAEGAELDATQSPPALPGWARAGASSSTPTSDPGAADPNAWRTPRWARDPRVPAVDPAPPEPAAADLGEDSGPLPAPPALSAVQRAERSAPVPPVLPPPEPRRDGPSRPVLGNLEPTQPLPPAARVPAAAPPAPSPAHEPRAAVAPASAPTTTSSATPSSATPSSETPPSETPPAPSDASATPGGRPRLHVGPATRWVPPARTPAPDPAWQRQSSSGFGPPPFDSGLHRSYPQGGTGPRIPAPTGPHPYPPGAAERTDWGQGGWQGYTTDPAWSIEPPGFGAPYPADEPVQRLVNQLASVGAVVLLVSAVLLSLAVVGVGIGFTVSRVPNGVPVSGAP